MTLRGRLASAIHPIGALLLAAGRTARQPPRTRTLMAAWRLNLKFPEPVTRRVLVVDETGARRSAVLGGALTVELGRPPNRHAERPGCTPVDAVPDIPRHQLGVRVVL